MEGLTVKLWTDILDILKQPFIGNLDVKHLFLLVGLVLVFIVAWVMILQHIRTAAMETL